MGKYVHKFNTVSDFNDYRNENYKQPWLSYTVENDNVDYNEYSAEDYEMLNTPLTFEALEDQTGITFYQSTCAVADEMPVLEIEISTDNGNTWITKQAAEYNSNGHAIALSIVLVAGEKVLVRGNNLAYGYHSESEQSVVPNCSFFADSPCYVYGNIMSLIDKNNFSTLREVTDNAFSSLFSDYNVGLDGSWLLSHPEKKLLLPATIVGAYCYSFMFYRCTNLTITPEISATTLSEGCCWGMFSNCTHLIKAHKLPATTLANNCYRAMFEQCTSLITAPELPATTLASYCYSYMFYDCSSLTTTPELPATTLTDNCYGNMFQGCTSLIKASELPATTLTNDCYSNMFNGCTSLTTAPELPATTLADSCYNTMFRNCTNLTTVPELPATTLTVGCYYYMFSHCTSLTTAPELPATTLTQYCYSFMFDGCTSLNHIKAMFTTTPSTTYTNNWVRNVASTGTFIKNASASWTTTGVNGVPTGWTVETASS